MQNFRASGGWELCPQTSSLQQLGASPPDPHWPPAAGSSAPRHPEQPPHCEFLPPRVLATLQANVWLILHYRGYRLATYRFFRQKIPAHPLACTQNYRADYAIQYTVTKQGDSEKTRRSSRSAATLPIRLCD